MNIYFIVEGKRTEKKVYKAWMELFSHQFTPVIKPEDATENNFYLISAEGNSAIHDEIAPAIENIKLNNNFQYLVIVADSEDISLKARHQEFADIVARGQLPENVELKIIIQHPCLETWFLGNRKAIKTNPTLPEACECKAFYDVRKNDPELMTKPDSYSNSIATYHYDFLRHCLRDNGSHGYSKSKPGQTTTKPYWDQLVSRATDTQHIQSFLQVVDFFETISQKSLQK